MWQRVALVSIAFIVLAGCAQSPGRAVARGAIDAGDYPLPRAAALGAFCSWRWTRVGVPDIGDDTALTSLECLRVDSEGTVFEHVTRLVSGHETRLILRYDGAGLLAEAQRVESGVTTPLAVRPGREPPPGEEDLDALLRSYGLPRPKVRASISHETVTTPAGAFHCEKHTARFSMLGMTSRMTWWYATTPLPLSRFVGSADIGPDGTGERVLLQEMRVGG